MTAADFDFLIGLAVGYLLCHLYRLALERLEERERMKRLLADAAFRYVCANCGARAVVRIDTEMTRCLTCRAETDLYEVQKATDEAAKRRAIIRLVGKRDD